MVQRIGGELPVALDVRVVVATHRPLEERVSSGLFRQDLLFRLNVLLLRLPPLRQRPGDIELLAQRFLANSVRDMEWEGAPPTLTPEALALLQTHRWPGNVRELRNLMARLAVRLPRGVREIGVELIAPLLPATTTAGAEMREGVLIPKGTTLADGRMAAHRRRPQGGRLQPQPGGQAVLGIGERTLRRKLNQ